MRTYSMRRELTKEEANAELEELAFTMSKIMSEAGIDIFEYRITAPKRKTAWTISAESKQISGSYKLEDEHED